MYLGRRTLDIPVFNHWLGRRTLTIPVFTAFSYWLGGTLNIPVFTAFSHWLMLILSRFMIWKYW